MYSSIIYYGMANNVTSIPDDAEGAVPKPAGEAEH
jgi:hypothetical protein